MFFCLLVLKCCIISLTNKIFFVDGNSGFQDLWTKLASQKPGTLSPFGETPQIIHEEHHPTVVSKGAIQRNITCKPKPGNFFIFSYLFLSYIAI